MADKRHGGVIFDVDGTLLDTNYLHVVATFDLFTEAIRRMTDLFLSLARLPG